MKYKTHYDAIPRRYLSGDILDVGCGDGTNQRMSTNWPILQHATGIDLTNDNDLFDFATHSRYDTVLAIHVIEHIIKEKWYLMFERLCSWVKPGGFLVIGTPYEQDPRVYRRFKGPENMRHVVFGINEHILQEYIRPVQVIRYTGPYSQSLMCIWRKTE